MNRTLILFLGTLLLAFYSACSEPAQGASRSAGIDKTTTIYLVRHAEKGEGEDPPLIAEGAERARQLSELLADESLDAVYSTDTRRTRETAAPSAEHHGREIELYNPDDLEGFAAELLQRHGGQTILVVGHSNTTPALANELADTDTESAFDDSDYGNLLVVEIPPSGEARIVKRRY